MDLLDRYRAGDHLAVWDELRHGQAEPTEAVAVCDATMQRVAENVDLIVDYLDSAGFRFAYPDMRRHPATPDDLQALDDLNSRLGAIPAALRSCLAIVGEVWLCGTWGGIPGVSVRRPSSAFRRRAAAASATVLTIQWDHTAVAIDGMAAVALAGPL
jgi:hypothetical protein